MTEKRIFTCNGQQWEYFVTYKEQKNMYLRLEGQKIMISAPFFIKNEVIENFLLTNINRIDKSLQQQNMISKKISLNSHPFVYFLNQKLPILMHYNSRTKLFLSADSLHIYSKYNLDTNKNKQLINSKINQFLKKTAVAIFAERLHYWEKQMSLQVVAYSLRLMKKKWGVCFFYQQTITFNYKLIHFSYQVIDYVIIHELAHLLYPNHSKDFWNLVAVYCPEYKFCRQELKNSDVGD